MNYYDRSKIGNMIAWGSEHIVYEYDSDKVIKFSIIDSLLGKNKGLHRANEEVSICKKYFGKYIIDTQIVTSNNHKRVAKVQPKISGRYLTLADMKNIKIREQFNEIVRAYNRMVSEGNPEIDLIGQKGLFNKCMSNVFVLENNELIIIDTTIFNITGSFILNIIIHILKLLVIPVQNRMISKYTSS